MIQLNRKSVEDDQIFERRSSSSGANSWLSAETVYVALIANRDVTFELLTVLSILISTNESEAPVLEVSRVFIVNRPVVSIVPCCNVNGFKSDKSLTTTILKNRELDSKIIVDDSALVDGVRDCIWKGRIFVGTRWIDSKVDKVATLKVHVVSNIGVESIAVKVDIEVEVALACLLARVGSVELRVDDVKVHVITGISEDGIDLSRVGTAEFQVDWLVDRDDGRMCLDVEDL